MNYINLHTHRPKGEHLEIVNIIDPEAYSSEKFPACSLSLHPWYLDNWEAKAKLISDHATDVNVLAIGECGLDKLFGAEMNVQLQAFENQIQLAEKLNKPVIVHLVKAVQEFIALVKKYPSVTFIVHGFNNNEHTLKTLIDNGCYISLGSALLNPDSNAYKFITHVPLEKLFLETDDSNFLISEIYKQASVLLSITEDKLKRTIFDTYTKTFKV